MTELSKKEADELDEFLHTHPRAHFLQSPEWARVKTQWEHEMLIVRDEQNKISGTMSILLRKIPVINRYIMYAPRGFVGDSHDKKTITELTQKAKEVSKKYKAFIFKLDPDILNSDEEFRAIIKDLGYKTKKNIKDTNQVIQPKWISRIDLKGKTAEEVLQSFKEKTRYNVRLATRKGVTIREGTREDLPIFHEIMKVTEARDDFYVRPLWYFEKIWDEMHPRHLKLLIAEYEGEPISAVLPVLYGNKVWYLYGGSSNNHRNLMPNYLLQFEMMKWALENNCDFYDFRGVSGLKSETHQQHGIFKFKSGFNGDIWELIDEMSIVYNPFVNTLFNIAEFLYKQFGRVKDAMRRNKLRSSVTPNTNNEKSE